MKGSHILEIPKWVEKLRKKTPTLPDDEIKARAKWLSENGYKVDDPAN